MQRILVGIDGTQESYRAAHFAANMAQSEGKELVLVHVLPPPVDAGAFAGVYQTWRGELVERRKRELEEVANREERANAPPLTLFLSGDDAAKTLALAAERDDQVDLVVVGHRPRGALARALTGSIADELVQICAKPVLVVP